MNNDASGRAMPVAMTIRHEQIQDLWDYFADDTIATQSKKIAKYEAQLIEACEQHVEELTR
jgi:hypothetical protein